MTQNTYTRIQRQNAITERSRRADDISDNRAATDALPQVPPNCSYSSIRVEVSQWDNTKFIVRGTIGGDCFTREVPATTNIAAYMQQFQHVYGIGAL